ncbi:MAG: hypothetical protein ACQEP7_07420 [bacterium]
MRDKSQIKALVYLLGDEDEAIYQSVRQELLAQGRDALPVIEKEIEKHSIKIKVRGRQLINYLKTRKKPRTRPPYVC